MNIHTRRTAETEDGAVAVLFSVLLLLFIGLLALVIDLGAVRADARNGERVADLSATAGALDLPGVVGGPLTACNAAWGYVVANLAGALPSGAANPCNDGTFDDDMIETCSDATPAKAATTDATAHPYTISILWPVTDDLIDDEQPIAAKDGESCSRIAVQISRTRGFIFGSIYASQGETNVPSVALSDYGTKQEDPVQLVLLDKTGCVALDTTGGGQLLIEAVEHPAGSGTWVPGSIAVDSDGTGCTGSGYTINAPSTNSLIATAGEGEEPPPPGVIRLHAQRGSDATCSEDRRACKQQHVDAGHIVPQPTRLPERVNRTPSDHAFNCKADYSGLVTPAGTSWGVDSCDEAGQTDPFIDDLVAAFGAPGDGKPGGYQQWTAAGHSCSPTGNVTVTGNWWVDCPRPSGFVVNNAIVTFADGNVVFEDTISVGSGGQLNLNTDNTNQTLAALEALGTPCISELCLDRASPQAAIAYARGGSFEQNSGGKFNFEHVAMYLRPGGEGPEKIKMTGGGDCSTLECVTWTPPTEGPFDKLSMWSESTSRHSLSGQVGRGFQGVYFTPNATTVFSGGSGDRPVRAQFFTWHMDITGTADVRMRPDPDNQLEISGVSVALIR